MADEVLYAAVIEPPVSVVNGLLEAMRRLASEVGARLPGVQWASPEHYLAPVAFVSGSSLPDSAAEGLLRAARVVEELGLQAGAPRLVPGDDGTARVVAPVAAKGDDLSGAVEAVAAALRDVGLEVRVPEGVVVTLAHVSGDAALEKVGAALGAPREAPLAGWLAGGLWVAAGPDSPDGAPWRGRRIRFVALKRLAPRRQAPRPPSPSRGAGGPAAADGPAPADGPADDPAGEPGPDAAAPVETSQAES